ncbi:MAG: divalent cation tolerance protein CutA [Candidatus Sungbacteria bacterium]|nr:divalent cation tolerance protein CutA [Candidatus Sungbacteria bacterium]
MKYFQVLISSENKKQADTILDALLAKKLILGGSTLEGPAKFWWKAEIVSMDYCYILTYTKVELKEKIIEAVNQTTEEEVPMISFIPFEANPKLEQLIDQTLGHGPKQEI